VAFGIGLVAIAGAIDDLAIGLIMLFGFIDADDIGFGLIIAAGLIMGMGLIMGIGLWASTGVTDANASMPRQQARVRFIRKNDSRGQGR